MKNDKGELKEKSNVDRLMTVFIQFFVIELIALFIWQGANVFIDSEVSLTNKSIIQEKQLIVEDVSISGFGPKYGGKVGCTLFSDEEAYLVYGGKSFLTIDPNKLIGKTIQIKYVSENKISRKSMESDNWVVIDIREGTNVYLEVSDLERNRIESNEYDKILLIVAFIFFSIFNFLISDRRANKYISCRTPFLTLLLLLPLLWKTGQKRAEYLIFLEEDRNALEAGIKRREQAEKSRIEHKKDEKYQKKVQRRKKRKRKMKKK